MEDIIIETVTQCTKEEMMTYAAAGMFIAIQAFSLAILGYFIYKAVKLYIGYRDRKEKK